MCIFSGMFQKDKSIIQGETEGLHILFSVELTCFILSSSMKNTIRNF